MDSLVVLGASSDIGMECLKRVDGKIPLLFLQGHQGLEKLERFARSASSKVKCFEADLLDAGATERLALALKQEVSAPSALLHLAAPRPRLVALKDCSEADFEANFRIQVLSLFSVLKLLLPGMAKLGNAQVLVMLTEYTLREVPSGLGPYVSAKFALLGLLRAVQAEYARRGLRVQALSPGMVETSFLREIPELVVAQSAAASPRGKNWSAAEIGERLANLLLKPEVEGALNLSM